ncbi:MAG: iron-containing alcohol dehydrogenase [Minwuiales bacterium]|nr:iron-containing alcohol dehydrogenase [Minwuiales bacterium]
MTKPESLTGNWNYPTAVRFGPGRIGDLPAACAELGMRRPLLVTDPGLSALPMVADAVQACTDAGLDCGLFHDVQANPVSANVDAGVAAYRAGGHDGVIAFGGGSGLDVGKAVAFMAGQTRPIWDFEDRADWWTRADPDGIAPIVAVPTTSGTGSEVGRAAAITDESDNTKKIVFHPKMLPGIVIADPALTVGLPPHITAATGMDALSHNLEAFCAAGYHPMADGIALEGMRLVRQWLPTAVADGTDIAARSHMMAASAMGATAFQKGLGAMHSLSHPCSSVLGTHHGLANGVVMPYVLAFNRPAIEDRMADLARYLDLPDPSFQAVLDWVLALRRELGIAHTLAELGVEESHVAAFSDMAAVDPSTASNPIPLNAADFAVMYRKAIAGDLDS